MEHTLIKQKATETMGKLKLCANGSEHVCVYMGLEGHLPVVKQILLLYFLHSLFSIFSERLVDVYMLFVHGC